MKILQQKIKILRRMIFDRQGAVSSFPIGKSSFSIEKSSFPIGKSSFPIEKSSFSIEKSSSRTKGALAATFNHVMYQLITFGIHVPYYGRLTPAGKQWLVRYVGLFRPPRLRLSAGVFLKYQMTILPLKMMTFSRK